jgi:hypothetical protein
MDDYDFLKTTYLYPKKSQMNDAAIPQSGATISTHNFEEAPDGSSNFIAVATPTFTAQPMPAIT